MDQGEKVVENAVGKPKKEKKPRAPKAPKAPKENKSKFDHSDFTDEEKKARGIETDAEKEERVKKQETEKSAKKAAKPEKPKKGAKKPAKAAKKVAKAKKAPKAPKATERPYVRHEGTKDDPMTGQKAPKRGLERSDLNDKELAVLTAVNRAKEVSLSDLAERTMPSNISAAKRNSWTRNSLRRLVREGFIKKAGKGMYKAA